MDVDYLVLEVKRFKAGGKGVGERNIVAAEDDQVHRREELLEAQATVLPIKCYVRTA